MGEKKEKKLNPRQKKFCLLRASGMKQIDAYRKAGYEGEDCNAAQLSDKSNIKKEIEGIQERVAEKTLDLAKECQALSPKAIVRLSQLLIQKKAPQVAIRAIQEVFDRGFGKPRETIDTGVTVKWDIGIRRIENKSE